MKMRFHACLCLLAILLTACQAGQVPSKPATPTILATTSILADITRQVAGDRLQVESLLPLGVDPHAYQPAPSDAAKIAESTVLIANGAGYEHFLGPLLVNAGGDRLVIDASAGLTPLTSPDGGVDPHFWLDPNLVITYVDNIRDGLSKVDPEGAAIYAANAAAYIKELQDLDAWIKTQVDPLTPDQRVVVTNHESMAYFAKRYGFDVIGAVVPSLSSDAAPSAQQMAALIEQIRSSGARAILLDQMDNPNLAKQISTETSTKVISDLHLESLTAPDGNAPNYIEMMKYNVSRIVDACKG
jgi:ABC-type Zn uptake system ZnuABC Zn-binding protein ZnuA